MKLNVKRSDRYLLLFKYLWIFVLLPKTLQFVVYALWLLGFINKKALKKTLEGYLFAGGIFIQIIAIIRQVVINSSQVTVERLAASLNTVAIWLVALVVYSCFVTDKNEFDLYKISKYMTINLFILLSIFVLSLILPVEQFTFLGQSYRFVKADYLETGKTERFVGLMENVVGVSHMFCLAFPISLLYVKKWKNTFLKILFCICTYIPVVECNSRLGIIVGGLMVLIGTVYLLLESSSVNRKYIGLILFIVIAVGGIYLSLRLDDFFQYFVNMFNSRSGSNSTRFAIYRESIEMTIENSPWIGMGIKYMRGKYPYGSHSTFIGFFYKSGIVGSVFFVAGLCVTVFRLLKSIKNNRKQMLVILMNILYVFLLVLTDLDGSNWYIVTRFALWGLLLNSEKKGQNPAGEM